VDTQREKFLWGDIHEEAGKERVEEGGPMEVYGTAALLAALFNITVGILIFRKNPHSKVAHRFLIATILLAVWGAAEALTKFSPNEQMSLLWVKISYVPFFILLAVLYYVVHYASEGRWRTIYYISRVLYVAFIMLLFTDSFIQKTSATPYGYEPVYGWIFPYFAFTHMAMMALGISLLYAVRMKWKGLGRIHQIDVMIYTFVISMVFVYTFELLSPLFGWGLPKIGSVFSIFITIVSRRTYIQYSHVIFPTLQKQVSTNDALCGALCSVCTSFYAGRCKSCAMGEEKKREKCTIYLCAKEHATNCPTCGRMLTCETYRDHREECPFLDPVKVLPSGISYRIESVDYTAGRKIFRDRMIRGDFGLIVSREHPDIFFSTWEMEQPPLIWLSHEEEKRWTINPTSLAKLTHIIDDFIKKVPFSCVLFEGIEYLVIYNSFDTIMKLVCSIDEEVTQNKCRFILSYDPRAFDEEKCAILERDLKKIPKSYAVDG